MIVRFHVLDYCYTPLEIIEMNVELQAFQLMELDSTIIGTAKEGLKLSEVNMILRCARNDIIIDATMRPPLIK